MHQSTRGGAAESFGALLKAYRVRAGLSQETLAEDARLSVETISALERGTRRSPYRETIALLASALMLSPSERSALESAAGRATPARTNARLSIQPVSGPSGNLPLQLTSFIGRATEVRAAEALLTANRLVTLTGPGGVGKTRVALRVAAGFGALMPDGVWLVELAALVEPALIPGTIAAALRSRLPDGPALDGVCALLAGKRAFVVLDNCEHLVDAVGSVATALLLRCPELTLLATSREALGIPGETMLRIPSLSVPDAARDGALTAADAPSFEAVSLFVDRARAVESQFVLSDANAPIVADICRLLDGIPLAIELAATRIKILSPRHLRDRLNERFRLLTGGNRDALPRQQTLRALIDWSYDLLDERERRLFRRVAVFVDGFTVEAASAICGDADADELDVLDLLASLVDKSLILATIAGDATRYRLLESTRMYAFEVLSASGERESIEAAYLTYFCEAMSSAERTLETNGSDASFVALTSDLENVRAALRYSARPGAADATGPLAVAAAPLFDRIGFGAEGITWLVAALERVEPDDAQLQSRIWSALAQLFINSDAGGSRAFEAAQRAVALARSAGNRELLAWALTSLAATAIDMHRRAEAEASLAEAAGLFGLNPKRYHRARLLAVRVYIARCLEDDGTALAIGEELRLLYRRLGNTSGELRTTINLAESLHALGETARAIALAREASHNSATERDRGAYGLLALNLTAYLVAAGDTVAARTVGPKAIELLSAAGPGNWTVATAIGHLALAHALAGDFERAARLSGYWDASWKSQGVPRGYTDRTTYERLSTILLERLTSNERAALFAAGAALTPQIAIAQALGSAP